MDKAETQHSSDNHEDLYEEGQLLECVVEVVGVVAEMHSCGIGVDGSRGGSGSYRGVYGERGAKSQ